MDSIKFVSKEAVLEIHGQLELEAKWYNNKGTFNFLFSQIENFLDSEEIKNKSVQKIISHISAIYLFYLAAGHCFNDGNKRTAFLTTSTFLILNNYSTNYDEDKIDQYLEGVNKKLSEGERINGALKELEQKIGKTNEFKMIKLLFDLAGASGKIYSSVSEIKPIVDSLIIHSKADFPDEGILAGIKELLEKLKPK